MWLNRFANLFVVAMIAGAVGLVVIATRSHAYINAVPTNCTFPTSIDKLVTFQPGEIIPSANWNQMACILDKLMRRSKLSPVQEKVCSGPTAFTPSQRKTVTLTASSAFVGSELVLPEMPRDEGIDPPAVALDGIDTPSGSSVVLWLFNRDADRIRTVTVCATVVRP